MQLALFSKNGVDNMLVLIPDYFRAGGFASLFRFESRTMSRRFSLRQQIALLWASGGRCKRCGIPLTKDNFHCDHRQPFSLGGPTTCANGQALCSRCNLKKGARYEEPSVAR